MIDRNKLVPLRPGDTHSVRADILELNQKFVDKHPRGKDAVILLSWSRAIPYVAPAGDAA
jgi:hypothetical protein